MFDPSIGQWFQEDPIDFDAGDPNIRRYSHNRPTNERDLPGLQALTGARWTDVLLPKSPTPAHQVSISDLGGILTGTITVLTRVDHALRKPLEKDRVFSRDGISIGYDGSAAFTVSVVQVLYRTIAVYRKGKDLPELIKVNMDTTAGKYVTTTDLSNPNFKVDTDGSTPAYTGITITKTDKKTGVVTSKVIFDAPNSTGIFKDVQLKKYIDDPEVEKIVSTGHYHSYFVSGLDDLAFYLVQWRSADVWTRATGAKKGEAMLDKAGRYFGTTDDPAVHNFKRHLDQINKEFPNQEVIKGFRTN